jgi:S-(hydroxymethyl)glutathione dehydrogenase/alcohol dehydrogenase
MIIGVDSNREKEAFARLAGVTHFIDASVPGVDVVGMIRDLTGGGADYAFECVGERILLQQAVECTRIGWGTTVMIGVLPGVQQLELRPRAIQEGRRLMGSYLGNIKTRTELPRLVDLYLEGQLRLDNLISHRIQLDQIGEGYARLASGQARRVVIEF